MPTQAKTDAATLRALLTEFNTLPPKVKTGVRRDLRTTGDEVIAGQRAILNGPLPAGIKVAGKTLTLVKNKKTGRTYVRQVNRYGATDVQRPGRSTGLRERIKASLVTRVVTGKTRQSIEIRTQNSKATMSTGWNSKRFRHPVFGNKERWAFQSGQPYFYAPVFAGRKTMIDRAIKILNDAVEGR